MRTAPSKDKSIRIRISHSDRDRLQQASIIAGLSVSDFIRFNSLAAASKVSDDN